MRSRPVRPILLFVALSVSLVACDGGQDDPTQMGPTGNTAARTFAAEVATTDAYAGAPQRIEVGVFRSDQDGTKLLTFGQVQLAFAYLGEDGAGPAREGPVSTASYVPAPGTVIGTGAPALSDPADARGVYEADDVTFDQAGIWAVEVTAEVPGAGIQRLQATFAVSPSSKLPAPGDRALRTKNLTMASKGVPPEAIDSLAHDGDPVPDPELHRWTIARAIAEHRPALVLFATPLYCESRFCGPSVDGLAEMATTYPAKAVFIHIEIWRDYQNSVINKAAADWLYRDGDLTEPWLFLIGADGVILDRWSPLFDLGEVAAALEALPDMAP